MKLYEINEAIRAAVAETEETGGEMSEAQVKALEALEVAFEEKVDAVACVVCEIEAEQEAFEHEAQRLTAKARSKKGRAGWLKNYLLTTLKSRGMKRVDGKTMTVRIQKSAPSLFVVDETKIPTEYWVQPPPELAKKDVLAAIKGGTDVPGAELMQGEHLRIE